MITLVEDVSIYRPHLRYEVVKVLGEIEYHPNREYPWLGKQGCVCQFFKTKKEAINFASEGE